jgi:hypothetical protein
MSNDRTNLKPFDDPANATQIGRLDWLLRDFCDINLRFVGNATKPVKHHFLVTKYTVSPLREMILEDRKTGQKSMARKVQ